MQTETGEAFFQLSAHQISYQFNSSFSAVSGKPAGQFTKAGKLSESSQIIT
jgi:hypothetical protein